MEFEIPVADTEVDTNDLAGSAKSLAGAVAGFLALFGVVGIASFGFSRVKSLFGVSGDTEIPGV